MFFNFITTLLVSCGENTPKHCPQATISTVTRYLARLLNADYADETDFADEAAVTIEP
jgi:hypothetical protein